MPHSKFATLHTGLLVRKGDATPAIASPLAYVSYQDSPPVEPETEQLDHDVRPQNHDQVDYSPLQTMAAQALEAFHNVESFDSASMSANTNETANIAPDENNDCDEACRTYTLSQRPPRKPRGQKSNTRVSVRITPEQRQLMKTVGAVLGWSQQRILSDAIDSFLETLKTHEMDGCACFKKRLQADHNAMSRIMNS